MRLPISTMRVPPAGSVVYGAFTNMPRPLHTWPSAVAAPLIAASYRRWRARREVHRIERPGADLVELPGRPVTPRAAPVETVAVPEATNRWAPTMRLCGSNQRQKSLRSPFTV